MTIAPSSCAGVLAKAPLNEPTGVRAALAMTIDSDMLVILPVIDKAVVWTTLRSSGLLSVTRFLALRRV
jgi:hypothetical protein